MHIEYFPEEFQYVIWSRKESDTKINGMCYNIMGHSHCFILLLYCFIEGQMIYFCLYVIMVIELIRLNRFIQIVT